MSSKTFGSRCPERSGSLLRSPVRGAWNDGDVADDLLTGKALEHLLRADMTYPEVGQTRAVLPHAYQHLQRRVSIGGVGRERFEEAANTLLGWDMHRRAGVSVRSSTDRVTDGAVAVLRLGWGVLGVDAPVRVAYTVDEERRKGFAYGTLPGHPERGEESFLVELHDSGEVTFTIRAFSSPASLLARVGGPVSRTVQSWVTDRYLRAL